MALKWIKDEGSAKKPSHLITLSRAMGEKEQINVNMYFDNVHELSEILEHADTYLNNQEDRWTKKQLVFEAKLKAVAAAEAKETVKKDKK